MVSTAFEVTESDIENVLFDHALRVTNTNGLSFEHMASDLILDLDHDNIEAAALGAGDDLGDQTSAALVEIKRQLVELGVIEF